VNHRPEATEDDRQLGALQRHTVGAGDAGGKEAAVHDSIHLQSTKVRRHTARIRSGYEAKKIAEGGPTRPRLLRRRRKSLSKRNYRIPHFVAVYLTESLLYSNDLRQVGSLIVRSSLVG